MKLYLEEGLPSRLICRELGVHKTTLHAWIRKYRECGEEGLKSPRAGGASARKDGPLHQKIAEVKRQQPAFGVKRISQWLRPRVITVPPYSRLPRAASLI